MSISLMSTAKIRRSGNQLTVDLGEREFVDAETLNECGQRLENLLAEYNAVVVMNLEGVKIIGASILCLWLSLRQRGWEVRLTNASPFVREILSITRLDTLFAVAETAV